MIVGSLSSNVYGIPHSTQDADILVRMSAAQFDLLRAMLPTPLYLQPQTSSETVTGKTRHLIRLEKTPPLWSSCSRSRRICLTWSDSDVVAHSSPRAKPG